ncbi:MAG: CorA family divalent cation transporter [Steroidobacteraceae bacterium]
MTQQAMVRQFRTIAVWPLQLMPVKPGQPVQRHWEALDALPGEQPWKRVSDEYGGDPARFRERHYKEFVTFLPYVQRFLYGAAAGQESATQAAVRSLHVYRRCDVRRVRLTLQRVQQPLLLDVERVELFFFLDADIALLAFEMHGTDLPLPVVHDILFRFGRAYPAFWDSHGDGGNCPVLVEWLDGAGNVLARSDFGAHDRYLSFAAQHRAAHIASHWEYLLQPLVLEYPGQSGVLRYRQLEFHRMPQMAYLACDDPRALTRADFVRLGLAASPGDPNDLPLSASTLGRFEFDHCDDRFWGRAGEHVPADSRIVVTDVTMAFVGSASDKFFSGAETGLLSQFRRQYFLMFLIAHFHKAALLSMSDELAVAMNRLTVGETESVRAFKRTIRQMMEVFLRFTHRYWFHEVSNQAIARDVFARLRRLLGNDELYAEVRHEVMDMNDYLDSDSARRQANTVLRLTVVTIFGLVGTVATGVLGMNLLDETQSSWGRRLLVFLGTLVVVIGLTGYSMVRSRRLADFLDALSNERVRWDGKWQALRHALAPGPDRRR